MGEFVHGALVFEFFFFVADAEVVVFLLVDEGGDGGGEAGCADGLEG